jgi:hypothetical protein
MTTLRIEHPVSDFSTWKRVFDGDPVGRRQHGVRRYRVLRAVDDANHVMIDLEFDSEVQAEAFVAIMRGIWGSPGHGITTNQRTRVATSVEEVSY